MAALSVHRRDAAACQRHAERAHQIEPEAPLPLHYLAAAACMAGDQRTAERYARMAVERGGSTRSRLTLANILLACGKYAEAEEVFRRILVREPGLAEALRGLGLARFWQGAHGEAISCLAEAHEQDPASPAALRTLVDVFAEMGWLLGAMAAVRMMQQEPAVPEQVRFTLDLLTLHLSALLGGHPPAGVAAGADEVVDRLLYAAARTPGVQLSVVRTLIDVERMNEASVLLERLGRKPLSRADEGQRRYLRGFIKERQGDVRQALQHYVAALEQDPGLLMAYAGALVLLLERDDESAMQEIGLLMERFSPPGRGSSARVLLLEGRYLQRTGQVAAARTALEQALRAAGDDAALAGACRQALTSLRATTGSAPGGGAATLMSSGPCFRDDRAREQIVAPQRPCTATVLTWAPNRYHRLHPQRHQPPPVVAARRRLPLP